MSVKDCMSKEVYLCTQDNTVKDVAKLMSDNHIGCIPVCDENRIVLGIVTDRDLILRSIACDKDVCDTKVTDIMTKNPCCCTEDTTLEEATKLMSEHQIRRIPVCDGEQKIVGILSLGDLSKHNEKAGSTLQHICSCHQNMKNAE